MGFFKTIGKTLACAALGFGLFVGYNSYILYDNSKVASVKEVSFSQSVPMVPEKRYALIITGKNMMEDSSRNTLNLVNSGLNGCGYSKIYTLGKYMNSTPSSKSSLEEVIKELNSEMTDKDSLFVYCLTHGSPKFAPYILGDTFFSLDKGNISGKEISEFVHQINSMYTICYFNGCFAARAAQDVGFGNVVGISPIKLGNAVSGAALSDADEERFGKTVSYFSLYFFSAMARQLPDGTPVQIQTDLNSVFDFAANQSDLRDRYLGQLSNTTPTIFSKDLDPKNIKL